MKKYQCHKVVEAALIIRAELVEPKRSRAVLFFADGDGLEVDRDFAERHDLAGMERVGREQREMPCYLVKYTDGYISVSPAKAFEEGYTVLPVNDNNEVAPLYHVMLDGDAWCAIDHTTFGCLAGSKAGFGATPVEALQMLNKIEAE